MRIWSAFFVMMWTVHVHAQGRYPGEHSPMPDSVVKIRVRQMALAAASDITVVFHDEGLRSASGLRGVPRQLRDVPVTHEQSLIDLLPTLYPYLCFGTTETLRFRSKDKLPKGLMPEPLTRYFFLEYINGIETEQMLEIDVSDSTRLITEFKGTALLDRGFPSEPVMPEAAAIQCTLNYAVRAGLQRHVQMEGNHLAEVFYRFYGEGNGLMPWWRISLANADTSDRLYFDSFMIEPSGRLMSTAFSSHNGYQQFGECGTD